MNKSKETTDSTRNTSILGEVERQGGARKTKEIKRKRTITKEKAPDKSGTRGRKMQAGEGGGQLGEGRVDTIFKKKISNLE